MIVKSPYYIFTPSYTYKSSGVRALHLLCDALNRQDQEAYIIPDNPEGFATKPDLKTPIIKPEYDNYYRSNDIEPIVIYPDVVRGNPLGLRKVVRWLLAPAGAYGGDASFPATDMIWGYTTPIAIKAGTDKVLCLPTFDTEVFKMHYQKIRSGSCFYSHKYDVIHGNQLLDITKDSTRLEGRPEVLADILRKSDACYVYEMSEIIINAQLCGCPVVLIRTPYFNEIPKEIEFPYYAVRWSDEEKQPMVFGWRSAVRVSVMEMQNDFQRRLTKFIEETQAWKI